MKSLRETPVYNMVRSYSSYYACRTFHPCYNEQGIHLKGKLSSLFYLCGRGQMMQVCIFFQIVNGVTKPFLMGVGGSFLPLPSGLITVGGGGDGWASELRWPRWDDSGILEGESEAALWRVLPLQVAPPPPTWRVVDDDVTNSRLEWDTLRCNRLLLPPPPISSELWSSWKAAPVTQEFLYQRLKAYQPQWKMTSKGVTEQMTHRKARKSGNLHSCC